MSPVVVVSVVFGPLVELLASTPIVVPWPVVLVSPVVVLTLVPVLVVSLVPGPVELVVSPPVSVALAPVIEAPESVAVAPVGLSVELEPLALVVVPDAVVDDTLVA